MAESFTLNGTYNSGLTLDNHKAGTVGYWIEKDEKSFVVVHIGDRWVSPWACLNDVEKQLLDHIREIIEYYNLKPNENTPKFSEIHVTVRGEKVDSFTYAHLSKEEPVVAVKEHIPLATYLATLPDYGLF